MTASIESLTAHFGAVVNGSARAATAADAVAGVAARAVIEPANEEQVAAALALAGRDGLTVIPRGGGTQLGLGFPPEGADVVLSTSRLQEVVEYNPHDLTVTVRAGMRLTDLQEVLAGSRQFLALDPTLPPAATVGGVIATNATGALRLRYGGVRDHLIGVRIVTADGTVAKGGGKVVKNVAGYDLPKLFTGSLGTLGVIVAATFRLYPLPAASRTVEVADGEPGPLCALAQRILGSTLEPAKLSILGVVGVGPRASLVVCFHSVPEAVADQVARFTAMAKEAGVRAQTLDADGEAALWQASMHDFAPVPERSDSVLLKVSVLPTAVGQWVEQLEHTAATAGLAARYQAFAGHGIIFARLSGGADALAAVIEPLRAAAGPVPERGSLVVWDAPAALARRVDMWGPSPALDLMRRVKSAFDPHTTLNPGRFLGRI